MEERTEYHITPRDPAPPESRVENYGLTPREFEVIRLLRRAHFWNGVHDRTAVIGRRLGKVLVLDCVQVSDS